MTRFGSDADPVRAGPGAPRLTETVTLSYLARGFDWAADYIATLSADGKSMDLGAWVTLANGNGVGFPDSRTEVVAGRVNRVSGEVQPLDPGGPILANAGRGARPASGRSTFKSSAHRGWPSGMPQPRWLRSPRMHRFP